MAYQPHAPAHQRRCSSCGKFYGSAEPGARWYSRGGQARYVHPGCQAPHKTWKPA